MIKYDFASYPIIWYTKHITANDIHDKGGEHMTEKEMIKVSIEEFSRLQGYMLEVEKDTSVYRNMKRRYIELKVFLQVSGVNITELDMIKE